MVSRAEHLHGFYRTILEGTGFPNITVTAAEKDALNLLIREKKPRFLLVDSIFYFCCTPFMMVSLHKKFPKLNITVISLTEYPNDLAMYCIINGARSYVNIWEGVEQFYKGLQAIRRGDDFISLEVRRRFELRNEYPEPSGRLSKKQIEIIKLVANGFTGAEIAETLQISERSVGSRKSEIYRSLNIRNENELIRVAIYFGIIKPEELIFFGRDYELSPQPATKEHGKKNNRRIA